MFFVYVKVLSRHYEFNEDGTEKSLDSEILADRAD